MTSLSADAAPTPERDAALHNSAAGRLARLCLKELKEILRDRRTMITLVAMPLMVYPLLAIVFQRFLITSLSNTAREEYVIGFESEEQADLALQLLSRGNHLYQQAQTNDSLAMPQNQAEQALRAPSAADQEPALHWVLLAEGSAAKEVAQSGVDTAIRLEPRRADAEPGATTRTVGWQFYYQSGSPQSVAAVEFIVERLEALNDNHMRQQLRQLGSDVQLPVQIVRHPVGVDQAPPFSLGALLPLILVLMTVTGAVYPAIDLTAGERERGTLETLIAAPVPRLGLLIAKYVAVLAVAVLTAIVNLAGMVITAVTTGLASVLFGESTATISVLLTVLALIVLFAAFFSAILLALTSCARSFKEAQAYIIPVMLLCLVPGIVCLTPGLQMSGLLAVTPLVNIVLLARDLLEGSVQTSMAVAAVVSTALYVLGAIAIAARIFGTDAILYGSQATWSDLVRRPRDASNTISISTALVSTALLFPFYFVLSGWMARSGGSSESRLVLCGLLTVLLFAGLPLLVASWNRVRFASGLGLKTPPLRGMFVAVLLGISLWPLAHEVFLFNRWLGIETLDVEQFVAVERLLEQWRQVSPVLILITLAVAPGVCEELFFRGFLFSALRQTLSPSKTIVTSAVLFGVFHVVAASALAPERFLPSTGLGLVLGWLCYHTASVVPSMILHSVHNGLLLLVAYYRDDLARLGLGSDVQSHLPVGWLVASAAGLVVAAVLIRYWPQRSTTSYA